MAAEVEILISHITEATIKSCQLWVSFQLLGRNSDSITLREIQEARLTHTMWTSSVMVGFQPLMPLPLHCNGIKLCVFGTAGSVHQWEWGHQVCACWHQQCSSLQLEGHHASLEPNVSSKPCCYTTIKLYYKENHVDFVLDCRQRSLRAYIHVNVDLPKCQ